MRPNSYLLAHADTTIDDCLNGTSVVFREHFVVELSYTRTPSPDPRQPFEEMTESRRVFETQRECSRFGGFPFPEEPNSTPQLLLVHPFAGVAVKSLQENAAQVLACDPFQSGHCLNPVSGAFRERIPIHGSGLTTFHVNKVFRVCSGLSYIRVLRTGSFKRSENHFTVSIWLSDTL